MQQLRFSKLGCCWFVVLFLSSGSQESAPAEGSAGLTVALKANLTIRQCKLHYVALSKRVKYILIHVKTAGQERVKRHGEQRAAQ